MLDALKIDTSSFASSYFKIKEENQDNRYKLRQDLASANNCIPIGASSCFADMVAIPREYQDVVIKICSGNDAFIKYAHLCVSGKLTGKHHLKIFSETEIAPGVWLFVMERLSHELTVHSWNMTVQRARDSYYTLPKRGKYAGICKTLQHDLRLIRRFMDDEYGGYYLDLHRGNVMCRKDGTIVYLDPVA